MWRSVGLEAAAVQFGGLPSQLEGVPELHGNFLPGVIVNFRVNKVELMQK